MKQEKVVCPFCGKSVTAMLHNGQRVYNAHWFDADEPRRYICPKSQERIKSDGVRSSVTGHTQ